MRFIPPVKEKVAHVIGEYFSTKKIVGVFTDANVATDPSLYAKWRITLDAFSKMSDPDEAIPHILEMFFHPLNFQEPETRDAAVRKLNEALSYINLEMKVGEKVARVVSDNGFPITSAPPADEAKIKTSTDYIADAITFFKNEYNKVRMSGLTYEYSLGENAKSQQTEQDYDDYAGRKKAIERLKDAGFITEYRISEEIENDGYYIWDYAVCKIDERQLTEPQAAPRATDAGAEALTQKIVHEHTHRFENSIQEKGIDLNHKFPEGKPSSFYITKKNDDFQYKGRFLNLSKKSDYYGAFAALYALLPEGGEASYKDLIAAVKSHFPKMKFGGKSEDEMRKFLQRNLTDKNNGFMRYASIPESEDNGKPLIRVVRSTGIAFNNKSG
jgi:hypothetical protein